MKYKLLIVSADSTILGWKTLRAKKKFIADALNKTKNGTWEVEVRHTIIAPKVTTSGRIDPKWYDSFSHPLFNQGYQFIYIHFSMAQWDAWGLDGTIRGANQKDTDFVGESYGRGDEHTRRSGSKENQFVQNVLHEMSHEIARTTGVPDKTHEYHAVHNDISGIFSAYDMAKWQPTYQEEMKKIGLLTIILELTKKLNLLRAKTNEEFTVPFPQWPKPTQRYGIANKEWYPKTGIHLGTDFGTPVGTEIKAPLSGVITRSESWPTSLGNWVEFKCGGKYMIFCHLKSAMPNGEYKQGETIAISGDTGFIKGIHTHVEGWHKPMDRAMLTAETARQLTFDVYTYPWSQNI